MMAIKTFSKFINLFFSENQMKFKQFFYFFANSSNWNMNEILCHILPKTMLRWIIKLLHWEVYSTVQ